MEFPTKEQFPTLEVNMDNVITTLKADRQYNFNQIQTKTNISRNHLKHALSALVEKELIIEQKIGSRQYYSLALSDSKSGQ
jgi:DNA-binding HxlR family transcriptional regulator